MGGSAFDEHGKVSIAMSAATAQNPRLILGAMSNAIVLSIRFSTAPAIPAYENVLPSCWEDWSYRDVMRGMMAS